jgi:osmotically-inducible protein OsmY
MNSLIRLSRYRLPAVLSVVSLGAACASTPAKTPAHTQADQALAQHVESALNRDPEFFFRHVNVVADNGAVSLSGYVWSTPAIDRAELVSRQVPGVTSVADDLELERNGSSGSGGGSGR